MSTAAGPSYPPFDEKREPVKLRLGIAVVVMAYAAAACGNGSMIVVV